MIIIIIIVVFLFTVGFDNICCIIKKANKVYIKKMDLKPMDLKLIK